MVTEIAGYYNGTSVILEGPVNIPSGQKVMVTVLENEIPHKKTVDLSKYMGRGQKLMTEDAQNYVNKLRTNDRF